MNNKESDHVSDKLLYDLNDDNAIGVYFKDNLFHVYDLSNPPENISEFIVQGD